MSRKRQAPALQKTARERAELLVGRPAGKGSQLTMADARRLARELQVRQTELELQNDELRRVRLEAEAARDRLSALYDFAPVGYLTLDPAGTICEANLIAADLLGMDRRKLLGKKFGGFVAATDRASLSRHMVLVESSSVRQKCQLSLLKPGGGQFIAELESVAIRDPGQIMRQAFVILDDATERIHLEKARSRLAAIVESSQDAIVCRDLNDIITDWNAGAERLLGYAADEIIGRPFALLVPMEQRSQMRLIEEQVLSGESPGHYETVRVTKDRRRVTVLLLTAGIRDNHGKLVGISTIARDVTRQKQADEALRHSERNLADFFAESPIGLLWTGPRGHVLRVNRAQLELLDRPREEVIGHLVADFIADEEIASDLVRRLAAGETLENYRARLRQRNGSLKHVLIDANGLWEHSKFVHARWFVRDISRRLELEREILAITEREQRRIGQDLHDDLGQQLAGIEFLTQTLARQLSGVSKPAEFRAKEISRMVQRAMVRARELARGLSPIGLESDGLMEALRKLTAQIRKVFRIDCRFICRKTVPVDDHNVRAHLYRIAQEAVNNAVKHGKASLIEIGLTMNAGRIILAVSDNGIGLPRKARPKNGLGLRIMQYRAGVIDASLVAQRRPDGGTTFVCTVREPGGGIRKSGPAS